MDRKRLVIMSQRTSFQHNVSSHPRAMQTDIAHNDAQGGKLIPQCNIHCVDLCTDPIIHRPLCNSALIKLLSMPNIR